MDSNICVDVYVGDFGTARISARTMEYMNQKDPNWREIVFNKRKRSKHARYLRNEFERWQIALGVIQDIAWINGETPEEI